MLSANKCIITNKRFPALLTRGIDLVLLRESVKFFSLSENGFPKGSKFFPYRLDPFLEDFC